MNKLRLKRNHFNHSENGIPRIISVISGKGGVGKSIIAFNLAERMASMGARILLVDGDTDFGNQHIFANLKTEYGFREFYENKLSLKEAVSKTDFGFDLLPSSKINLDFLNHDALTIAGFVNGLREQGAKYDIILIDQASGLSKLAAIIAYASDLNLLVLIPELTSISDVYGLFKYLIDADAVIDCQLLINRCESNDEAEYIFTKFCAVSERFIQKTPSLLGSVSEDDSIRQSIAAQTALFRLKSDSKAATELSGISSILLKDNMLQNKYQYKIKSETINKTALTADIKE